VLRIWGRALSADEARRAPPPSLPPYRAAVASKPLPPLESMKQPHAGFRRTAA